MPYAITLTVLPATRQRWESRLYRQPKQVLDLATPEGRKAELTYVTWKRTGWDLNPRPIKRKSNALPQRQHATLKMENEKSRMYFPFFSDKRKLEMQFYTPFEKRNN